MTATIKATAFIVPVWGDEYIATFVSQSIESLLAEGNFPALGQEVRSALKIVTHSRYAQQISELLDAKQVQKWIDVLIIPHDEAIDAPDSKYSAMTACFLRAMAGPPRYEYNVFLSADIFMGAGGVSYLLRCQERNVGVVAGAFPMVTKTALEFFRASPSGKTSAQDAANQALTEFLVNNVHPSLRDVDANRDDGKVVPYPWLVWLYPGEGISIRAFLAHPVMARYPETDAFLRSQGSLDGGNFVALLGYAKGDIHMVSDSADFLLFSIDDSDRQTSLRGDAISWPRMFARCAAQYDALHWNYLRVPYRIGLRQARESREERIAAQLISLSKARWVFRIPFLAYRTALIKSFPLRKRLRRLVASRR